MIKQPWLIQRAKVTNSNPKPTDIFSDCISLDYMGSSEFEWGVVPATISSMHSVSSELKVYEHLGDKGLFILCLENQQEQYQQVLNDLLNNKIRTKEFVFSSYTPDINLWMDLDNKIIFSTDKVVLENMSTLLANSQKVIAKNQAIKKESEDLIKELALHKLREALPGGMVALSGKSVDENPATINLKESTKYNVVYWLNGPRINNTWLCGYYTVESIQEFIKSKTGVIAQAITDIQTKTKKHA